MRKLLYRSLSTPWLYALLYLIAIPAFALIYQNMWAELRYSASLSDPTTDILAHDAAYAIVDDLSGLLPSDPSLDEDIHVMHEHITGPIQENSTQLTFFRVAPMTFDDGKVEICRTKCEIETADEAVWNVRGEISMPVRFTIRPVKCATFYAEHLKTVGSVFDWVPSSSDLRAGIIEGRFPVGEDRFEAVRRYVVARTGRPVRTDGGFGRFLYFSTATITTLGIGDIVPASDRTRLVVSIESIVGIIIAGLFINAVALRTTRPPN